MIRYFKIPYFFYFLKFNSLIDGLMAQMVKNLPAVQKMRIGSMGREDPWETGMAAHSSIPAWRIPRTEELGRLHSTWSQESDMTERLTHAMD